MLSVDLPKVDEGKIALQKGTKFPVRPMAATKIDGPRDSQTKRNDFNRSRNETL